MTGQNGKLHHCESQDSSVECERRPLLMGALPTQCIRLSHRSILSLCFSCTQCIGPSYRNIPPALFLSFHTQKCISGHLVGLVPPSLFLSCIRPCDRIVSSPPCSFVLLLFLHLTLSSQSQHPCLRCFERVQSLCQACTRISANASCTMNHFMSMQAHHVRQVLPSCGIPLLRPWCSSGDCRE